MCYMYLPYGTYCDIPTNTPGSRYAWPQMCASAGNCAFQAVAQR